MVRIFGAALAAGLWALAAAATAATDQELAEIYAAAVNRGDAASVAAFAAELSPEYARSVPPGALEGFFEDQLRVSGGVETLGVRRRAGAPSVLQIALRNRIYGGVQAVELTLEGAEPRISYLDLAPAPAWALAAGPRIGEAELAARVEALAARGCEAGIFSGAVLLAKGDRVLAETACGEASRRFHAPNRVGTRFNLGSMDKMFTAVAAMRLAEQGRLDLQAPVGRYLDADWLDPAVAARITVWQLMTHTSGLEPDAIARLLDGPLRRYRDLDDLKPLVADAKPGFTPGERFEYSNTGYILLGAVVASVAGQDYHDQVREAVFAPAGMTASGAFAIDDPVEDLPIGHVHAPAAPHGWRENIVRAPIRGGPAGGGYATVGDLHRFARALQSGRLVSEASLDRLWADPEGDGYGAGFEVTDGAVGPAVGHSGILGGVSARMRIYRDSGYVAVVLSNIDRGAPPLLDAIEGEPVRAGAGGPHQP